MSGEFDSSKMENWDTHPRGMMNYYQSMKYELGQSIADLIDNCFDGGATKIKVDVGYANEDENKGLYFRILDNGRGMTEFQLSKAMVLGAERKRAENELGVFGIGMKLSALAQANQVTIVSKHSERFSIRRIDASYIKNKNENHIFKYPTDLDSYKDSQKVMIDGNWSTMVLLEDIHNKKWRTWDKAEDESLVKELQKIKVHLRLTYQRILDNSPDTELIFQEKRIEPLDPAMAWENDTRYGSVMITSRISMKIENVPISVKITMVIIPHSLQFKVDKSKCTSVHRGYKKANDMQGLYLYRNDRLIDYGGWQRLLGDTNDEHDKCGKIFVEIPPKYYEEFGLNPTKTEVNLPAEFMRKLSNKIDEKIRWGQINSGKEIGFRKAIRHRYDNEGKKAINRDKKREQHKKQEVTGTDINQSESTQTKVPLAPSSKSRTSTKFVKPKPVVKNIDEDDPNWTIVQLDKQRDGYDNLIQLLRMWEE